MSSYSVGNNVSTFRVSESSCFTKVKCNISSGEVTTVSDDYRLFVSAKFASMLLGARGVDSDVSPCYCCVCWRCARVVEGADCKSAHVGSIPTSVSGAASPRRRDRWHVWR